MVLEDATIIHFDGLGWQAAWPASSDTACCVRAQAYSMLWTEAARLVGDKIENQLSRDEGGGDGGAFSQPADPVSSLLVLPGFVDQKDFKRFVSSVTLGECQGRCVCDRAVARRNEGATCATCNIEGVRCM